jgi:DNA polymerase-3 subunit epsilon
MREIVFDTETTGLNNDRKDRVLEIACVEIIDNKRTGKTFCALINPQRLIPMEAQRVHGRSDEDVAKCPPFSEVWPKFLEFVAGDRLIAHNSSYDEMMVDQELRLMGKDATLNDFVSEIVDSIRLSKRIFPERKLRHNLDALLDRLEIDRSTRTTHSALLDCSLLADAYTEMQRRRELLPPRLDEDCPRSTVSRVSISDGLKVISATPAEIQADLQWRAALATETKRPPSP